MATFLKAEVDSRLADGMHDAQVPYRQPCSLLAVRQGMGSMPSQDRVLKEMKVRIPRSQHIKLHGLRLVRDQGISESVRKALETYFERTDGHTTPID